MPVLVPLNMHTMAADEFDEKTDILLIAAYNKLPHECTAENLPKREYRPWLLKITDEVNAKTNRTLDHMDYILRLQQHRKSGRLGNRGKVTRDSIGGSISGMSEGFSDGRRESDPDNIVDGVAG